MSGCLRLLLLLIPGCLLTWMIWRTCSPQLDKAAISRLLCLASQPEPISRPSLYLRWPQTAGPVGSGAHGSDDFSCTAPAAPSIALCTPTKSDIALSGSC